MNVSVFSYSRRACVGAKLVPPYKVEFRAVAAQIE